MEHFSYMWEWKGFRHACVKSPVYFHLLFKTMHLIYPSCLPSASLTIKSLIVVLASWLVICKQAKLRTISDWQEINNKWYYKCKNKNEKKASGEYWCFSLSRNAVNKQTNKKILHEPLKVCLASASACLLGKFKSEVPWQGSGNVVNETRAPIRFV